MRMLDCFDIWVWCLGVGLVTFGFCICYCLLELVGLTFCVGMFCRLR